MKELLFFLKNWIKKYVDIYNLSAVIISILLLYLIFPDFILQYKEQKNMYDILWYVCLDSIIIILYVIGMRIIVKMLRKLENWLNKG